MRAPISTEEEACMPQAILARTIGLLRPLSFDEMQDVIDAALATDDDFESSGEPPTYTYIGDRWQVEFRLGRPHLIDAVNVPPAPPRSAVAAEETRFGLVVDVLEMVREGP
ncbi:MAG: hypothetical protein WCP21_14640 [Armatimonadota bacterium]